jgi:DNA-binding PadR family transcriptional regulator
LLLTDNILGSGALYGAINKMLEQGLIAESDERPDPHLDDERRRYYRITPLALILFT